MQFGIDVLIRPNGSQAILGMALLEVAEDEFEEFLFLIRDSAYRQRISLYRLMYLPMMSNSRLTTVPGMMWWKLVTSKV